MARVLVLGGTGEARELADVLATRPGLRVVTSLAGRVRDPRLPVGEVRIGGFGGPDGLADWLRAECVDVVVDATHPFARRISASAVEAAAATGVSLLVLRRPGWEAGPEDAWFRVESVEEAAAALPGLGKRVMLTTGRQGLAAFALLDELWFLVRVVDPPQPPVPRRMKLLLDRGPYTVEGELALMREHGIDVLVTKDSGGAMTAAKLTAARRLGLPVVVVDRPALPEAPSVATVTEAVSWLESLGGLSWPGP
jgi:precorrin-6A/cobalt-precorrin-6A reductase